MKYAYNLDYYPPISELEICLINGESGLSTGPLPAIIDTGADATIVPMTWLRQIEASVVGNARLRSGLGDFRNIKLYLVDIQIAERTLPGIRVIGDITGKELVLGRDAINRMRLLLDGLSLQSDIQYLWDLLR